GWEKVPELEGHFSPVRGIKLLHDVADVDLDGAFAQVEFVGDDLVRLAAPERFHDLRLPHREEPRQRSRNLVAGFDDLTNCEHAACWHEDTAGKGEFDHLRADPYTDIGRYVATGTVFQGLEDLGELVRIRQDDDRRRLEFRNEPADLISHLLVGDILAADMKKYGGKRRKLIPDALPFFH